MHNKMASTPLIRDASVIVPRVRDGREWQRDKVHDQINYTAINQTRENRAAHDNRDPQARYIECGRPNKRNRVMHDHAEHDRRSTDSKSFREVRSRQAHRALGKAEKEEGRGVKSKFLGR